MNIAVIDIDNTLWDFSKILHRELSKEYKDIPPVGEWKDWDFWKNYMDSSSFYRIVHKIHINQEYEQEHMLR